MQTSVLECVGLREGLEMVIKARAGGNDWRKFVGSREEARAGGDKRAKLMSPKDRVEIREAAPGSSKPHPWLLAWPLHSEEGKLRG